MSKTLVAYFSASGVTAGKAKKLADKLGAVLGPGEKGQLRAG